jgi:hypothetical protein
LFVCPRNFYDNIVHDQRRFFLEEEKLRAERDRKKNEINLSGGALVGIILGSLALSVIIFCCLGYCLCACVREMLCCVKNLVCCCCDE